MSGMINRHEHWRLAISRPYGPLASAHHTLELKQKKTEKWKSAMQKYHSGFEILTRGTQNHWSPMVSDMCFEVRGYKN